MSDKILELEAQLKRAKELLKASHDLLKIADESTYIEQATAIVVHYDEADCDGYCLMDDIGNYLEYGV